MKKKTIMITSICIAIIFIVATFLPLLMTFVSSSPVYADIQSDIKKKQNEKKDVKDKIEDVKAQKKDVLAEKELMDVEIQTLDDKIYDWNAQIAKSDEIIKIKQGELDTATKKADDQYETFKSRMRIMYEEGPVGYLDVLFSSKSITDFLNRMEIVKQISAYDKKILDKLEASQKEIETAKVALETEKQNQIVVRDNLKSQVAVLDKKQGERDQLMKSLDNKEDELLAMHKKMEKEEAALQAQYSATLRSLQKTSNTKYVGGSMEWPAPGYYSISSSFGMRFHPVLRRNKLHTGVDVAAPYGAKVVASNAGTVIKAGFNSAYGNHIIVDHGGGRATLYAHGSKLLVSSGQQVTRGQNIMIVGSTGYSTGAHLHFEVIVNGDYTNPMSYFN